MLRRRSEAAPPGVQFRLVRSEGRRAVVEVGHRQLATARALWTGSIDDRTALATVRTWGTLLGAKAWLNQSRAP